jgi:hypothetical protein
LAGATAAPRLLAILLENNPVSYLSRLAETLRDLKEPAVGSASVEALKDEGRPWQIRWMLTVVLEGYPESATILAAMLEEPDLDERVKVGIAATLGTWKNSAGLSSLREAFESALQPNSMWSPDTNPPNLRLYYPEIVNRLLRNLLDLDSAWASSVLAPYINTSFSGHRDKRGSATMQEIALSVLAETSPELVGEIIFPQVLKFDRYFEMYQGDYRKLNSKKYRPMAARKESRNVLSGRR